MGIFEKLMGSGIKDAVESIGGIIDKISTSDDERLKAKQELTTIVTDFAKSITTTQADVLKVELTGNWLQRCWRPIIMMAFGFIVCYEYFLAPVFNLPKAGLPEQFWSLLEIGMGGYVIGRTVEKVADSVTSNMDKIPRKN